MLMLTNQERRIILFLLGTALFGIGINFAAKNCPCIKGVIEMDERVFKIDINKATYEDLACIQRMAPRFAKRIIEYRNAYGSFKNIEELKEIKGVGNCRYERLKELFFVE